MEFSHFLEHLHFKGTKKRLNAKIISEEFDSMGSLNNAQPIVRLLHIMLKVIRRIFLKC
jgi:acid stress-induced BolA-like protein IbaG/YrbA